MTRAALTAHSEARPADSATSLSLTRIACLIRAYSSSDIAIVLLLEFHEHVVPVWPMTDIFHPHKHNFFLC